MPHTLNRAAFDAGRNSGSPLLSLYCTLVVIELALKDQKPSWESGHRIIQLLNELNDAGVTALGMALSSRMLRLICTDQRGYPSAIAADRYPDLRYLRFDADFPGTSAEADIEQSAQIAEDIRTLLATLGIVL